MNGDELFRQAVDQDDDDGGHIEGQPLLIVFGNGAFATTSQAGALLVAWAAFASFVTLAVLGTALGAAALWLAGVAYEHLSLTAAIALTGLLGIALGAAVRRGATRGQRA